MKTFDPLAVLCPQHFAGTEDAAQGNSVAVVHFYLEDRHVNRARPEGKGRDAGEVGKPH